MQQNTNQMPSVNGVELSDVRVSSFSTDSGEDCESINRLTTTNSISQISRVPPMESKAGTDESSIPTNHRVKTPKEFQSFKKESDEEIYSREKTVYEIVTRLIIDKVDEKFVASIPSDEIRSMTSTWKYVLGGIIYLLLFLAFILLILRGISNSIQKVYLSPNSSPPKPLGFPYNGNDSVCSPVPKSITGTLPFTRYGYWQGDKLFESCSAAYILQLFNVRFTKNCGDSAECIQNTFDYNIEVMTNWINSLSETAKTTTLAKNILIWTTLSIAAMGGSKRFQLAGNVASIFDSKIITGTVSAGSHVCESPSVARFDSSTGRLSMSFRYSDFSSKCSDIIGLDMAMQLGYAPTVDQDDFTISLDSFSLLSGVTMNYLDLIQVNGGFPYSSVSSLAKEAENYQIKAYVDPRYPGKKTHHCVCMYICMHVSICTCIYFINILLSHLPNSLFFCHIHLYMRTYMLHTYVHFNSSFLILI